MDILLKTSPYNFAEHEVLEINGREVHTLVVSGTPYDMGVWIGRHLGKYIQQEMKTVIPSLTRKVSILLNRRHGFKEEVANSVEKFMRYVPQDIKEEMSGIYEGCREIGYPIEDPQAIEKLLTIIELGEQECTLFAMQPPFTSGHTYQMRDLDYYTKIDMSYTPVFLVRIPQTVYGQPLGIPYASFDFIGNLSGGVINGINQKGVAFSQSRGPFYKRFSYDGMPLKCLIPTILNKAATAPEAINIIKSTPCATDHFVIISDPRQHNDSLQLIFMEPGDCTHVPHSMMPDLTRINYDDEKLRFYEPIEGAVYWTDMVDRKVDGKPADFLMRDMHKLLQQYQNKTGMDECIEIAKVVGNDITFVSCLFDTTDMKAYVAYRDWDKPAHYNSFMYFDLKKYFSYSERLNTDMRE